MDGHVSKPFKQASLLAALENTTTARDTGPAVVLPTATPADAASELPILDRAAFEEIAATLSASDLEENLRMLIARGEALLCGLRMSAVLSQAGELAEAAHKLAGGAGTFGLLSTAAAARRFEAAIDRGAADTAARADHLAAAIEASIPVIRQELLAVTAITT
jgi:HPt (histidine-containing phosphotransfer) domain-containing protein